MRSATRPRAALLVAATTDLAAARNRLDFAKATRTPGALDHRVAADVRAFGVDAFVFEILDRLEITPAMTPDDARADLGALEQLWREKLAAELQTDGASTLTALSSKKLAAPLDRRVVADEDRARLAGVPGT